MTELTIQLEAQSGLGNKLLSARDDALNRLETRKREHNTLMSERTQELAGYKVDNP